MGCAEKGRLQSTEKTAVVKVDDTFYVQLYGEKYYLINLNKMNNFYIIYITGKKVVL